MYQSPLCVVLTVIPASVQCIDSQINTAAVLVSLGTLIQGVPSATISSITSSQLLTTTSNTVFINNMLTAPTIVQQTYINKVYRVYLQYYLTDLYFVCKNRVFKLPSLCSPLSFSLCFSFYFFFFSVFLSPLPLFQQIISIDQSINQLMVNVPDALAVSIPRVLLTSSNTAVISQIVQKTWKPQQVIPVYLQYMSIMIWILERILISHFGCIMHRKMHMRDAKIEVTAVTAWNIVYKYIKSQQTQTSAILLICDCQDFKQKNASVLL